jgi:hypothetical protein
MTEHGGVNIPPRSCASSQLIIAGAASTPV